MFIKPTNLVSSIETHFIPCMATLRQITQQLALLPYEFEIDEFIDGELFHCDVIAINDQIVLFMAAKYAFPLATFSKGNPMGSVPVIDASLTEKLKGFTQAILAQIGGFSSGFHVEVFLEKKSQELIFLEIAARTPGALVPEMYDISHQMNLEELHYLTLMGQLTSQHTKSQRHYAGWITYPKIKGKLLELTKPCLTTSAHNVMMFVEPGDDLEQAHSLLDSAVSILFWDTSWDKLEEQFEYLKTFKPLLLEQHDHEY